MAAHGNGRAEYACTFCGKPQSQVGRLIAGPGKVFICNECVHLCQQIMAEEAGELAPLDTSEPSSPKALTPQLIHEQLDEYVGRMPILAPLDDLTRTEPKNAVVKQFQHLFSLDGVDLVFTPDGLDAAADEALRGKTGARGLRAIIEGTLLDVMFDLPSRREVRRCIIDDGVIHGHKGPLLLTETGSAVDSHSTSLPHTA